MGELLKFTEIEQEYPDARPANERRSDFHEIYKEAILKKAEEQAARCSQCGVPFCQSGCPLGNNIPDWLKATAEGRLREAYEISAETNPAPEICGRICPQDRLCEKACVIEQSGHGSVTIGAVEKYLGDTARREGWIRPLKPGKENGLSIAVIGSGPAGLALAEKMRFYGYAVTVYESADRAGGLLIYGIPGFKLEKDTVLYRIRRLEAGGIRFVLNVRVGEDIAFKTLQEQYDGIFIAIGVCKPKTLHILGAEPGDLISAQEYLFASSRKSFNDRVENFENGKLNANNKKMIVIGGGDTAMDCVRSAIRQGAATVTCLYRRDRENMPGSARETVRAEEEGVFFEWLSAPKALLKNQDGSVKGLIASRMSLGTRDQQGRRAFETVQGSEFTIDADMILEAPGFEAEDARALFNMPDLTVRSDGTIFTSPAGLTSVPGVFAGGDIVRGASLAVWALKDGRDIAENMHKYLTETVALQQEAQAS